MPVETLEPEIQAPQVSNKVEELITKDFSSPELWTESRNARPFSFLKHPWSDEYNTRMEGEYVVEDPEEAWLTYIYGLRLVPDEEASTSGAVKLVGTELET